MINLGNPLNIKELKTYLNDNNIGVLIYKDREGLEEKLEKIQNIYTVILPDNPKMIEYVKNFNPDIPIIVATENFDSEKAKMIFSYGVYDYLDVNNFSKEIIKYRIKNAVVHYRMLKELIDREDRILLISQEARENFKKIDELNRRLLEKNKILEVLVEARTKELQGMTNSLISALENANLYNDEDTGDHLERVAEYAGIIAEQAGLPKRLVKEIKIYSPLHDIGKVGIPDAILKKPGKYTDEEFDEMKKHVLIGYNMIKESTISDVAKNIILYHHEKWNGLGYIEGKKGNEIPIEARVVAVADVFDALTSKRSYKPEFDIEKTIRIMNEGRGEHFDPHLIDVLNKSINKLLAIKERYKTK